MSDNRSVPRYSFGIMQRIAPITDGKMPSRDEFGPAACDNLSRTGFAFYTDVKPDFDELVVELGTSPEPAYLTAAIVHTTPVEKDGHAVLRIGCGFTGRALWSERAQSLLRSRDIESAFALLSQDD